MSNCSFKARKRRLLRRLKASKCPVEIEYCTWELTHSYGETTASLKEKTT